MKTRKALPSAEILRSIFTYDPGTGALSRRASDDWRVVPGPVRGELLAKGHTRIKVEGSRHLRHNIIWKMRTGLDPLPGYVIDHRDGDPSNDKWDNLREATNSQNSCNKRMRKDNSHGLKCVSRQVSGRYQAYIGIGGKRVGLGTFDTKELAHAAYREASAIHHGQFGRVA